MLNAFAWRKRRGGRRAGGGHQLYNVYNLLIVSFGLLYMDGIWLYPATRSQDRYQTILHLIFPYQTISGHFGQLFIILYHFRQTLKMLDYFKQFFVVVILDNLTPFWKNFQPCWVCFQLFAPALTCLELFKTHCTLRCASMGEGGGGQSAAVDRLTISLVTY